MKTEIINVTKEDKGVFEELYDNSALTIEGLTEDSIDDFLNEIDGIIKLCRRRAYIIKGDIMNAHYGLTDRNAYPEDLNIVAVKLEDLSVVNSSVAGLKISVGGRWFDDIVDNNSRREVI